MILHQELVRIIKKIKEVESGERVAGGRDLSKEMIFGKKTEGNEGARILRDLGRERSRLRRTEREDAQRQNHMSQWGGGAGGRGAEGGKGREAQEEQAPLCMP